MILTPPTGAMAPFYRHLAKVTLKGGSHTYSDSVLCAVLWGLTPGDTGDQVTVIVRAAAWRAEFPPAPGAVFSFDDHGRLDCQRVTQVGDAWHCTCLRNQRARATT